MSDSEDRDYPDPGEQSHKIEKLPPNQVYFYEEVNRSTIFTLNHQLEISANELVVLSQSYRIPQIPINLYINSEGGDVLDALCAVDRITDSIVPIHTYIEGIAASAATLMSVCASKRFIRKNSFMLIHSVSGGIWGNFREIQDETKNIELLMSKIKSIYLKHTKFSPQQLDDILKRDIYMDAEECLKVGLVDAIV